MARTHQTVLIAVIGELAPTTMTVTAACLLVGIAHSTYYRLSRGYQHYTPVPAPIPQSQRVQPTALTPQEHQRIVDVLTSDDHAELSVVQAYWRSFDAGTVACSQRTFYREANKVNLVGDRRRPRGTDPRSVRHKPVAVAAKVGDLWSWDVTDMRGPRRGQAYKLYLAIDVFSRYPVGWRIEYAEDRHLAVEMFGTAIAVHGAPTVLHADNGAIMRSHFLIDALEASGVLTSYSRPRICDDNPFSESLFKTIKYDLTCPDRFESIEHARRWTGAFLDRYAREHRHSGLGRQTPTAVHYGTADVVQQQRQQHLDRYYAEHPERFRCPPRAPDLPQLTGINIHNLSQTG